MKKAISFLLCFAVLFTLFPGCAEKKPEPLRLLVDLELGGVRFSSIEASTERFLSWAREQGGPEDVEVEYLPGEGAERETAVTRLRTEIMSGKGPDLFLLDCPSTFHLDPDGLFPYPEKAMNSQIFLPLDELIETAGSPDWEKLTPQVMAAGQTEEGQLLVPLAYTFGVTLWKQKDMPPLETGLTWQEAAESGDPALTFSAAWDPSDSYPYQNYLSDVLGDLADYGAEKLAFSQDDLFGLTKEALDLRARRQEGEFDSLPKSLQTVMGVECSSQLFFGADAIGYTGNGDPLTMAPFPNRAGGITATVSSYAGISRNTKRPEDAFALLDLLLDPKLQKESMDDGLWDWLLYMTALPIHEELGQEEHRAASSGWYLDKDNFQELCRLREQITAAKFNTCLDQRINRLYLSCKEALQRQREEGGSQEELDREVEKLVSDAYVEMQLMLAES